MQMKKVLAVVMSLCMTAGVISCGAPVIAQSITAQADAVEGSCYSFDASTGELRLRGTVDDEVIRVFTYKQNVKSVIAEEGTILPENCSGLFAFYVYCTSIDLSKADTSRVTNMSKLFSFCYDLEHLDISGFDTSKVTNMSYMFECCNHLSSLDLSGFDTSKVTDMKGMFISCSELTFLDVSSFDTSNVTNMGVMFDNCSKLVSPDESGFDVSGFNTSNVTDMTSMFGNCEELAILDVSNFNTSKVTDMFLMFGNCFSLTSLDLSGFDTSNVTNMSCMFGFCSNLTSLDLSGFDTSNVTKMSSMFANCSGLTSLDLSEFDTSNVTQMIQMFYGCSHLKTLDLSNFDTSKVFIGNAEYSSIKDVFTDCVALNKLTLGEKFAIIPEEAQLLQGGGWVNANTPTTVISGDGEFAVIENSGKNTYKRLPIEEENHENALTYPTNIKVEYSKEYHQVRFTWDKVEGADRYGIAVYLAGKWRVQTQNITGTVYTSPKNLTPGRTYRVAIAARVNGTWDTTNAIKHSGTVTIR